MLIGKNEKIVFIGDSVTDCGRVRPVGEGLDHPMAKATCETWRALCRACTRSVTFGW